MPKLHIELDLKKGKKNQPDYYGKGWFSQSPHVMFPVNSPELFIENPPHALVIILRSLHINDVRKGR